MCTVRPVAGECTVAQAAFARCAPQPRDVPRVCLFRFEHLFERSDAFAPPCLHLLRGLRIRQAFVLEADLALGVLLRGEADDDAGGSVLPIERAYFGGV